MELTTEHNVACGIRSTLAERDHVIELELLASAAVDAFAFISSPMRRSHPSVNELLFRFLTSEVRTLNERLLEALYVPVEERVLRRLVELRRFTQAMVASQSLL